MIKTILIPVLVGSFALCARASEASVTAGPIECSSQDFQSFTGYAKDVHLKDEGGRYFWAVPADGSSVSTEVGVNGSNCFLGIEASDRPDEGLVRTLVGRIDPSASVVGAYTADDGYNGYYLHFRTQFTKFDEGVRPELDGRDRLVFWQRGGNRYVTAGRFVGNTRTVEPYDYSVGSTDADDAWYEVDIRVIPEIQTGARALGFEIWINGESVVAQGEYPVADGTLSPSVLTPEARVLIAGRRLFPALTVPGVNESVALGGLAFTGSGSIDNIAFSTDASQPSMVAPRVFTLKWDAGVKSLSYSVGSGASVAVSSIADRSAVFEIPSSATEVKVNVTYNTDYSAGVWRAEGACSLDGTTFRADASANGCVGCVGSAYPNISIGGGEFASFAEAKAKAKEQGLDVIALSGDFLVSADTADEGSITIARGEAVTIDLKGHVLGTTCGEFPTIRNYGTLTIIDTVGGGVVKAYAENTGDLLNSREVAVLNYASLKNRPTLTIKGGVYEGRVNSSGEVVDLESQTRCEGNLTIVQNGSLDEPKFLSPDAEEFEFGDKLQDTKLYYSYEAPYWKPAETGAFIWSGKGSDDAWSTAANWRCNEVPGEGEYVYFPSAGDGAWEVALDEDVGNVRVRLVGDVNFHGSADLTSVTWDAPVNGRVGGDAVLTWSGKLPPDLSTLLADSWAGTIAISGVGNASPKLLTDMASWGTASSKVRFNGVRGYYHQTSNVSVPWTLELVDGADGYAWKNDAGFTGGVIEFPAVVGSGRFVSPKNTIANRQVIVFRDVSAYTGALEVYGKRLVLGPGSVGTQEAGSITWSDGVKIYVAKDVVHACAVAAFGGTMEVDGRWGWGFVLANYTGSTVGDSAEVVTLMPGEFTAELCVDNPVGQVRVEHWSENAVVIDGRRVVIADEEAPALNSLSAIRAPLSAVSRLPIAKYYSPTVFGEGGDLASVRLELNELAVPVLGIGGEERATVSFSDGLASIVVSKTIRGLWYGLEYKASLESAWERPEIWEVAGEDDGLVELVAPAEGASGFYRVVVSDVSPAASEKGDGE